MPRGLKQAAKRDLLALWCLNGRDIVSSSLTFTETISKGKKEEVKSQWLTEGELKGRFNEKDAGIFMANATQREKPQMPGVIQWKIFDDTEVNFRNQDAQKTQSTEFEPDANPMPAILSGSEFQQLEDTSLWPAPSSQSQGSALPAIADGDDEASEGEPEAPTKKRPAGAHPEEKPPKKNSICGRS